VRPAYEVTVIVPALNEEATIAEVIERVLAIPFRVQLIVVNDGSTDRTPEILAGYGDRILVLHNPTRGGKGNAIRKAVPHATGRATIIQDADLEYFPEEIGTVVGPILKGEANAVYGSRFHQGLPKTMALPNKIVNRLLEPFSHINVVVTATEWDNFFLLRDHGDAEPHIALLARRMREAMDYSKPKLVLDHEWHMPYWGTRGDNDRLWAYGIKANVTGSLLTMMARQISAARCARVSYLTHDGKPTDPEDDLRLFQQLIGDGQIKHLSPLEHVAQPNRELWSGNFRGWKQLRKDFE